MRRTSPGDASPSFASSSGSPLLRQGPRRGKLWLEIKYSRQLVSIHVFPEPIQEPGPSFSVKFSGPWGPTKLWMLGPGRSCLDNHNLFSQVWEQREGTRVGTGFCDSELLLVVPVSFRFPYTLSLDSLLGSILSDQSLFPELRPDVGEAALATELCGLDRAGRQTQHAKCSGPFKMSRQEARLGEKQRHSPHTRVQAAFATPQEPREWVPWVPSTNLQHIFTGLEGVP